MQLSFLYTIPLPHPFCCFDFEHTLSQKITQLLQINNVLVYVVLPFQSARGGNSHTDQQKRSSSCTDPLILMAHGQLYCDPPPPTLNKKAYSAKVYNCSILIMLMQFMQITMLVIQLLLGLIIVYLMFLL